MKKINYIDLFAGCGGLSDGFESTGKYNIIAAVEWEKKPLDTLVNRLTNKYDIKDADEKCLHFDIQRTEELFSGWTDNTSYGNGKGLNIVIGDQKINFIIGGPPCQAYSIAGRIRDRNGMKYDYRNYLFESYIKVVDRLQPDIIVFENVPGMLSAKPNGINISEEIKKTFFDHGYTILDDLDKAIVDVSDYGVPQMRKRVIIIGVKTDTQKDNIQQRLLEFYSIILPKYNTSKSTVKDAIGHMPKILPSNIGAGRKTSYNSVNNNLSDHHARYHNERDINIFKILASDKLLKNRKYKTTDDIKELYNTMTGKKSNIHKYHVLDWNCPSTTIVSHLQKDGLRHIHPDPEQARSITIREAARLQSFDDDFEFFGGQGDKYKMIGNAVPPLFAHKLALALVDFYKKNFK